MERVSGRTWGVINEPWGCLTLRTSELRCWEMIFASTWDPLWTHAIEFNLQKKKQTELVVLFSPTGLDIGVIEWQDESGKGG